jgi:hypothetical protein
MAASPFKVKKLPKAPHDVLRLPTSAMLPHAADWPISTHNRRVGEPLLYADGV